MAGLPLVARVHYLRDAQQRLSLPTPWSVAGLSMAALLLPKDSLRYPFFRAATIPSTALSLQLPPEGSRSALATARSGDRGAGSPAERCSVLCRDAWLPGRPAKSDGPPAGLPEPEEPAGPRPVVLWQATRSTNRGPAWRSQECRPLTIPAVSPEIGFQAAGRRTVKGCGTTK